MATREDTAGFVWHGVLDPALLRASVVDAGHRFADAAKAGDWSTVLELLDDPGAMTDVNAWRPGGTAWFTPLHQVAWHGAPVTVAAELVSRGALRSLTDAEGRTAYDIRVARDCEERRRKGIGAQSNFALISFLHPPALPCEPARVAALDGHLAAVIDSRIKGVLFEGRHPHLVLRYPTVTMLNEIPGHRLWFPVPGMYGGFDIELRQGYLEVRSWCRVWGGSGQAHVITVDGAQLVDQGFV